MPQRPLRCTLVILLTALAGCDDAPRKPPPAPSERITVVATTYPLAEIAREIGGQYVSVEWLSEAGQPLGAEGPRTDVQSRLRFADLVISSGETWAIEGFDDPMRSQQILRIDTLNAAKDPAAPGGYIWLDPVAASQLAEELANRFAAKLPSREANFRKRTASFLAEMDAITEQFRTKIATAPIRRVIVLSDEFDRLLWRFKVRWVKAVEGEPTRLSSTDIREIRQRALSEKITTLLVRADTPAAVMRDLSERTGLRVIGLDPLGSSAGDTRDTYLKLLRYDLEELAKAVAAYPAR